MSKSVSRHATTRKHGGPAPLSGVVIPKTLRLFALLASAALLATLTAATPAQSRIHLVTVPAASGPWLDRFNSWRSSSSVSSLSENATWSNGDVLHSTYLVKNNTITHYEVPGQPYYTTEGYDAGRNGNIYVSSSTGTGDVQAIDFWMQAPFHALGMMDPRLTTTGFGSYREATSGWSMAATLDVLRGNSFSGGTYPVYFPGNGSTEPLRTYGGGEFPDPLATCSGYAAPTGLPVFVQVGGNVATTAGPVHTFTGNGTPLEHCILDSNTAGVGGNLTSRGAVVVIPKAPLQTGVTYTVTLTVNSLPYTWTFNVGTSLITTPGPPASVTSSAGDGTATVTWNPPSSIGGIAITSYTVTPYIGSTAQAPITVSGSTTTVMFSGLANGTTYWFRVTATNSSGTGPPADSASVTPTSGATPPARMTAPSMQQYQLPNSDGTTWQDMDATNLSLSVTPTTDSIAVVSANADLWTASSGYNQDLGIWMSPTTAPAGIVAWKESGGSAGTFSPNAAAVQTVVSLTANVTYSFKMRWKTNRSAIGASIYAGAGPLAGGGGISPARLSVQLLPASNPVSTAMTNQQYSLAGNDGATWQPIDATNLVTTVTPSANSTAVLSANIDLWTANSGYNQDIGIFVSVNTGADQLVAWKESGGSAGTYSPNAAFVQATYNVSSGSTYVFKLKWKTNKSAGGATIFAGAGPIGGLYSPTRLTVQLPAPGSVVSSSSTLQVSIGSSDGAGWAEINPAVRVNLPAASNAILLLGGNADLWTANAGFNQDLGIFVSVNGGADQLLAWKESGGFAGTFSPNAAFVHTVYSVSAGSLYVFRLKWKTNTNAAGATIFAGAGPIAGQYSPTSLTSQIVG